MNQKTHIILFISMLLCYGLCAQGPSEYSIKYIDSLSLQDDSRFAYNNLTITNRTQKDLQLHVAFAPAPGWKSLQQEEDIILKSGETRFVPLTLTPLPTALAQWQPFQINITNKTEGGTKNYFFQIKAKAIRFFFSSLFTPTIQVRAEQKSFVLKTYFKNSGNVPSQLTVSFQSSKLGLNKQLSLQLAPGKDTILPYSIKIDNTQWKEFLKDEVYIHVKDSGVKRLMIATVNKVVSELKPNPSAYATMPIELETGYMKLDNQGTYFGSIRGTLSFKNDRKFSYYYRTKDFGMQNQVQQNLYTLQYNTQRASLMVGQLRTDRFFISDGTGIKADYKLKNSITIGVSGSWHNKNSFFRNDTYSGRMGYKRKAYTVDHYIGMGLDHTDKTKNVASMNTVRYYSAGSKVDLEFKGGFGKEISPRYQTKFGLAGGYTAIVTRNKWTITSAVMLHSKNFPGFNRGLQSQNHLAQSTGKKWTYGGFYQSNRTYGNFFRDTVFNTNATSINVNKYGALVSYSRKKSSIGGDIGRFIQTGAESNTLATYNYYSSRYYLQGGKGLQLRFDWMHGFGKVKHNAKEKKLTLATLNSTVQYKFLGVNAFYTSIPLIEPDSLGKKLLGYDRTFNLAPQVDVLLLKKLSASFNYTFSKSLIDDGAAQHLGTRITYINARNGINLSLYGRMPVVQSNLKGINGLNNEFYTLSFVKKINVPLLMDRRFHTLTVIAFEDRNGNGLKEEGERPLKNILVSIDGTPFITDARGVACYKNISKGTYTIDLNEVAGIKGFIPASGNIQRFTLHKSMTYLVPFKKSKIIHGNIRFLSDSLAQTGFTTQGLKIFATDSSGQYFSTLSNEKGEFYLNVPAGIYHVSLNPEAFDQKVRPVVMSHKADLSQKDEFYVEFAIEQEKRKVRLLTN